MTGVTILRFALAVIVGMWLGYLRTRLKWGVGKWMGLTLLAGGIVGLLAGMVP